MNYAVCIGNGSASILDGRWKEKYFAKKSHKNHVNGSGNKKTSFCPKKETRRTKEKNFSEAVSGQATKISGDRRGTEGNLSDV